MEIRQRKYIDVHYNESEQKSADQIGRQLKSRGYILVTNDLSGSEYHYCDQYLGCEKIKQINNQKNGSK